MSQAQKTLGLTWEWRDHRDHPRSENVDSF